MDCRENILAEIADERARQDAKWGEQNHPAVSRLAPHARNRYAENANKWKRRNELCAQANATSWDGILLEEVYEALAEEDPAKRRAELVQVAATAIAEIECIDRRAHPSTEETSP